MIRQDFLFEIGTEELPPKSLKKLAAALLEKITQQLTEAEITYQETTYFATPRRLAVLIEGIVTEQPNQMIERQGPSVAAAFDKDGTPTLACIGFARSCGVPADQLEIRETNKGKRVFCRVFEAGKKTVELLPEIVINALEKLPISKPMRWSNEEKAFIRPVHWLLMLFGYDIVDMTLFSQKTSDKTYGHRFHHPDAIQIKSPKDYEQTLLTKGKVIADVNKRKLEIHRQIKAEKAVIDDALLNEVTGLVEWPVALKGQFNAEFLEVPPEALITSMKVHQKCFPMMDEKGKLLPYFILVSNIESKDSKAVIKGNERVINARLSDAAFFYDNDLRQTLSHFVDKLKHVVFQKSLGTLFDRTKRLEKLSTSIAKSLNISIDQTSRAAVLAKFDLMSEMVGEFPELQGIMGYYYAKHAKEKPDVAKAIREHYYPRFSGDRLPEDQLSCSLALADRLDIIVGILGINKMPTGEKDPYALKRAALGVVRILIEKKLPLDLHELLTKTLETYQQPLPNKNVIDQAFQFIMERMRSWYIEQGVSPEIFQAVQACEPTMPLDFDHRLKAVLQFQALPESSALAAANKRVSNILKKTEKASDTKINVNLFELDAERKLAKLLEQKTEQVDNLYKKAHYTQALSELATLKESVDLFFDEVMIMVDDKKLRENRLALLTSLHHLFTQVADISLLP